MKLKKIAITALLTICGVMTLLAQTTGEHCVAFTPVVDSSVGVDLSDQQEDVLRSKISQILTRNNAATTSLYNGFAITPQISIVTEESMTSGIRPVTAIAAELTLLATNIVDNSDYGSITVEVKATGNTREQAVSSIINSIRPADPRITKFINSAINKITDYYTMNMPTILRKTETLMAGEKYDDALVFLESIPTCVPAYEQSSEAIKALYAIIADKSCTIAITMANRYIAIEDYDRAKEVLLGVRAGSECDGEITELLAKINELSKVVVEEPEEEPTPEPEPEPAPAPAVEVVETPEMVEPSNKINEPFADIDLELISCEGDKGSNIVTVVILVKNVADLEHKFEMGRSGTIAYNNEGDEFGIDRRDNAYVVLRPGMSRKSTFTFSRVPAKNGVINMAFACYQHSANKGATIDVNNVEVKW